MPGDLPAGTILEQYVKGSDGSLLPVRVMAADYADEAGWALRAQFDNDGQEISSSYLKKAALVSTNITIPASAWDSESKSVAITATGLAATSIVLVVPTETSAIAVANCGVSSYAVTTNTITFSCEVVPSQAITFSILIINI